VEKALKVSKPITYSRDQDDREEIGVAYGVAEMENSAREYNRSFSKKRIGEIHVI